jgi:hypothetical protein
VYLAYAKTDIEAGGLLGLYMGKIQVGDGGTDYCFDLPGIDIRQARHQVSGSLYIDAHAQCNELAFVNDFRADVLNFDDISKQAGKAPNCETLAVWFRGSNLPQVAYIATEKIMAGEEILIDYGDAYWTRWLRRPVPQAQVEVQRQQCREVAQQVAKAAASQLPRHSPIHPPAMVEVMSPADPVHQYLAAELCRTVSHGARRSTL